MPPFCYHFVTHAYGLYASRELIDLLSEKSHYLFRLRTKFSTKIDDLPLGSHVITMYDNVKVRIVKFTLPSGETQTLMTDLFDLDEAGFKDLYFRRWRIEVKYDVVKNKLEMPCFGGFPENVIMHGIRQLPPQLATEKKPW